MGFRTKILLIKSINSSSALRDIHIIVYFGDFERNSEMIFL